MKNAFKMKAFLAVAFLAAVSVSANAALFQFHDYLESPDIAWLTVDGTQVTGNGSYGGGTISNFSIDQFYQTVGERISFDWQYSDSSAPSIVYTVLWGAQDEPTNVVSDEFLGWTTGGGVYHIDFISYDSDNGVMSSEHPDLVPLPALSNLTAVEAPYFQDVGYIYDPYPNGPVHDTFQVMSVPEPATFGLLALGGLALAACRRRSK